MSDEAVTLTTPDGPMEAFVARPEGDGPFAALIVAQEAFGVNDHMRDVCRRFAREGYVALAPELFHRAGHGIEVPYDQFPAVMPYLGALTNEGIESDLAACFAHLRGRADVDRARVGVIGFCVGGFVAFLAACRLAPAGTVSFYGGGIVRPRAQGRMRTLIDETGKIRSPILCLFGAEDQGIPPADVETIRARLDALDVAHEVVVYPGAGHAFFCDARSAYREDAARDAWRRVLDWFGRHLRAGAASAT